MLTTLVIDWIDHDSLAFAYGYVNGVIYLYARLLLTALEFTLTIVNFLTRISH
jgi:hypothetical protein